MEKWEAGFHICFSLYIVANAEKKNFSKKWGAEWFFGSAVKWAEMAADHENGQNSRIFFLQLTAIMWAVDCLHKIFCQTYWLVTYGCFFETAEKRLF